MVSGLLGHPKPALIGLISVLEAWRDYDSVSKISLARRTGTCGTVVLLVDKLREYFQKASLIDPESSVKELLGYTREDLGDTGMVAQGSILRL